MADKKYNSFVDLDSDLRPERDIECRIFKKDPDSGQVKCKLCDYSAKKVSSVKQHYESQHNPEAKRFSCEFCFFRATWRCDLAYHLRTHTGEKPHKCPHCDSSFAASTNLAKHIQNQHTHKGARPYVCTFPGCSKTFAVKGGLTQHNRRIHEELKPYACPQCPMMFYGTADRNLHLRRLHFKDKPFKCNSCTYTAVTSYEVKTHVRKVHVIFDLECKICNGKFLNKRALSSHQLKAHPDAHRETGAKLWKCETVGCEREFQTLSGQIHHQKSYHLGERPYKCPFCEFSTTTSSNCNLHIVRAHTEEKPYKCDECERCFTETGKLRKHKASAHSELRPFACDKCSFRAKTKEVLKRHKWTHTHEFNSIKHKCTICWGSESKDPIFGGPLEHLRRRKRGYFSTRAHLRIHMKTHTDLKVHTGTKDTNLLDTKTQSNEKLYKLPVKQEFQSRGYCTERRLQTPEPCQNPRMTKEDCKPCFVRLVRVKRNE